MKTKNNNQKTESSHFEMMVLRASVVVFSLVLISLTATSAQELWEQFLNNTSSGKMEMFTESRTSEFKNADAAIDAITAELAARNNYSTEIVVFETEVDEELEVEAWMTDEACFSTNASLITEETDEALNMEAWMIDHAYFNNRFFDVDAEPAPEVEAWITDETYSTVTASLITEETDEALNPEDWMIDHPYFNNLFFDVDAEPATEVEIWMTSENFFGTTEELSVRDADLKIEDWMLETKFFSNEMKFGNKNLELNARNINRDFRGF